jgi:hypothetical protein
MRNRTSTLKTAIDPGESSSVVLNVSAPLDVADTAEYEIVFSSSEGPSTISRIKLNLRRQFLYLLLIERH